MAPGIRGSGFHDGKFQDVDDLSSTSSRRSDITSSLEEFSRLTALEMYQEIIDHCPFAILVDIAEHLSSVGLRSEELEHLKVIWRHGEDNGISSQAMSAQIYFPPTRTSPDGQHEQPFSSENTAEVARCQALPFTTEAVKEIFKDPNGNSLLGVNTRWTPNHTRALEELFESFCNKSGLRVCEMFYCTVIPAFVDKGCTTFEGKPVGGVTIQSPGQSKGAAVARYGSKKRSSDMDASTQEDDKESVTSGNQPKSSAATTNLGGAVLPGRRPLSVTNLVPRDKNFGCLIQNIPFDKRIWTAYDFAAAITSAKCWEQHQACFTSEGKVLA
jgi:hypothetical protein